MPAPNTPPPQYDEQGRLFAPSWSALANAYGMTLPAFQRMAAKYAINRHQAGYVYYVRYMLDMYGDRRGQLACRLESPEIRKAIGQRIDQIPCIYE